MKLEEFKQKFNLPRINDYLKQLDEDEVNWFWQALWQVKQIFPTMDIYHTGYSKYGYIGVGIKPNFETPVSNFILSSELNKHKDEQGNFKFFIGVVQTFVDSIVSEEDKLEYWFESKNVKSRNFQKWLEQIKKYAVKYNYSFSGQGLLPTDYKKQKFTAHHAIEFLKDRFPNTYSGTKHISAFRTNSHRQLALDPKTQSVSVFCDEEPPENTGLYVKTYYEAEKTRNHHLSTHAPNLDKGFDAYLVSIDTLEDLEKFCDWYELNSDEMFVNDNLNEDKEMQKTKFDQPLNRILFGAAGTGKTFNTINHALSIIENKSLEVLEQEDRTGLKVRFDEYKEQGQIKFVTFHQSFSYEDFVEGIRAETDDIGQLNYDVQSGVFKEICKRAVFKQVSEVHTDKAIDEFVKEISQNEKVLETKTGVEFTVFNSSGKGGISVRTTTQNEMVLSKKAIKNYLLDPSENIRSNQAYAWAVARYIKSKADEKISENTDAKLKNFVLIIDEINRGNISRIFGELITLIEDSKRQDTEEELSVTLPYSKEEFSIPSNVYIIGTMNSSDRSLTGLDIALRRRFTFVEMQPKPELLNDIEVEGLNIGKLLKVINQRIEVLLDRDHCMGHANFLSLKKQPTLEHLAVIFKQKIIPQLQEYFFDDWSKINMVLNANGMLKAQTVERSVLFPNVNTESEGVFEDQKTWQIVETAFDSIDSFAKIIRH